MKRYIRIVAGSVQKLAELNDSPTADAVWESLPLEAPGSRWGDEIYFSIPVSLGAQQAKEVVEAGDLAYWPPGKAFCIFWGPTPASSAGEIRPASPVNVFGRILSGPSDFGRVRSGSKVRVERAQGEAGMKPK